MFSCLTLSNAICMSSITHKTTILHKDCQGQKLWTASALVICLRNATGALLADASFDDDSSGLALDGEVVCLELCCFFTLTRPTALRVL